LLQKTGSFNTVMSLPLEMGPTCQWHLYLLPTVHSQRSNLIFDFHLSLLSYLRSNWKSLGCKALALAMQVTNPTVAAMSTRQQIIGIKNTRILLQVLGGFSERSIGGTWRPVCSATTTSVELEAEPDFFCWGPKVEPRGTEVACIVAGKLHGRRGGRKLHGRCRRESERASSMELHGWWVGHNLYGRWAGAARVMEETGCMEDKWEREGLIVFLEPASSKSSWNVF
jgi:hypothetical protein